MTSQSTNQGVKELRDTIAIRRSRRGLSLMLVVSVMLILVVVATGFAAFTSQDMRASQTNYEQNETYFLAEAGIDYGLYLLKASMLVFPAPPAGWVDDGKGAVQLTVATSVTAPFTVSHSQPLYNADSNNTTATGGGTGLDMRGSLISLNTSTGGQEHVVISDLGYVPANNWMSGVRTCGTFLLKAAVSGTAGGNYTVQFTSTGYIKQIPNGVTVTSTDAGGNPTGFANVAAASWTIIAQRTLVATVNVSNPSFNTITGPTSTTSIQVKVFNEKFR